MKKNIPYLTCLFRFGISFSSFELSKSNTLSQNAPVAQLDRVPDYEKIVFTVLWTIIGLWLTIPVDDGRQIGDMWMDGGDLLVKTGEPTFDVVFFAVFMIPVALVWIWGFFKEDSKQVPIKRRSRMM